MPSLEKVDLRQFGVSRKRHQPLSVWYGQPVIELPADPPFVPVPTGHATALQTLDAILKHEDFLNSECKPAIVILPELAVPFADVAPARALISAAPKGTIVAFGVAALTEAQALSIENNPQLEI